MNKGFILNELIFVIIVLGTISILLLEDRDINNNNTQQHKEASTSKWDNNENW